MSSRFPNDMPKLQRTFEEVHGLPPLKHDAVEWEPVDDREFEEPSEKHLELHHTPGGVLEQEVHTQIDRAARISIEERSYIEMMHELPDEQELNFGDRSNRLADNPNSTCGNFAKVVRFEREKNCDRKHERER